MRMTTLYPDLTSTERFPSFDDCPLNGELPSPCSNQVTTYLLGTIQLEATLSTSPTYICKDRSGKQFAVTVRLPPDEINEELRGGGFDVAAWKRGWCLAVPSPKRSGVKEGKQGYIVVKKADIMVFPTNLDRLIHLSQSLNDRIKLEANHRVCQACGAHNGLDQLRACRGCEATWYCQKECQILGWNQNGHKNECKSLKALKRLPLA